MKTLKALRVISVSMLMTSIVVVGHGDAQARPTSKIPTLAGITKVVGSESAWMRVRLPTTVNSRKVSFDFDGNGRAIALYLVHEEHGRIPRKPVRLDAERFGQCFEEACEPSPYLSWGWGASNNRLPAGIYRLYLITDGAPVEVTFNLHQLEGATQLTPAAPAQALVQTSTTRVLTEPSDSAYSGGDAAPFSGRGAAKLFQWLDPSGKGTAKYGACVYEDEPPADETTAYLPENCPSPFQDSVKGYEEDEGGFGVSYGLSSLPAALGTWYTATTPVEVHGSVAVWLKF